MIAKARAAGRTILQGPDVFKLYDTYGFPMDLIAEACREQGMTVDEAGFDAAIEEQRTRARKTGGFEQETARPAVAELAARLGATKFVGYDRLESDSILQAILKGDRLVKEAQEGDEVEVVLDVTPFYAEGGGQVGDQGVLVGPEGRLEIKETTRPVPTMIVHKGRVSQGAHPRRRTAASVGESDDAAGCRAKSYGDPSGPCGPARSARAACQTVRIPGRTQPPSV